MNEPMKRYILALTLVLFSLGLACAAETVPIIFDTDMAGDCDDVGALAVLNALADAGEAKILAVVTNRRFLPHASAAAVDVINTYYGRGDLPVGTDKDGVKVRDSGPSTFTAALRDEFPHDTPPDDECADALDVYRATLAAQPDNSVVICSVGTLSNLEDLLRSGPDKYSDLTGADLVKRKVKRTVIMGGDFPRSAMPETNIKLDVSAAITVANEWPSPIQWLGFRVGKVIISGDALKSSPKTNPVRRAFELRPYGGGKAIDRGKPSYDQATVLLAVRGSQPQYWTVVDGGHALFDSQGNCQWKTDGLPRQSYIQIHGDPKRIARIINELMTAVPAESRN